MANLPENTDFWPEGIYQIEETDVVRGGDPEAGGTSNIQGKQLADRTAYLLNRLGRFEKVAKVELLEDLALTPEAFKNTHVSIVPKNGGKTILLDTTGFKDGAILSLSINTASLIEQISYCVAIKPAPGSIIKDALRNSSTLIATNTDPLFLYVGETLTMIKMSNHFYIKAMTSNYQQLGEIVYSARQPYLSVEAKGQLLDRKEYPRLWNWIEKGGEITTGDNGTFVTDARWLVEPNDRPSYKGCFSKGNGTTTFRMPDLRGVFLKGLDNGRNLDLDRPSYNEGSYQGVKRQDGNKNDVNIGFTAYIKY